MDYAKILKEMSTYMDGETIVFDESSWSYDSVELTINGSKTIVRSAWINDRPLALMVEVDDEDGELETISLTPDILKTLDEEEVYWVIHDIWFDIPYEGWDDDDCEDALCELMKKAGISENAKYFFGNENYEDD